MRRGFFWMWVVVCFAVATAVFVVPGSAQTDEAYEATISALQTEVAEWESKHEALKDRYDLLRDQLARGAEVAVEPDTPDGNALGVEIQLATWALTADSTEIVTAAAPGSVIEERARGQYLVVNLTVVNTTSSPARFPFTDFMVIDSAGRTFSVDEEASVAHYIIAFDDTPRVLSLQPGIPYPMPVLFDVAPDGTGFTLFDTSQ
jgi:hypothetical protein